MATIEVKTSRERANERAGRILANDRLGATAIAFRELDLSVVAAGAALSTTGEMSGIVRDAVIEQVRIALDRRAIARWFDLDRLPPDAQIRVRHSNSRPETHIGVYLVEGREIRVMERIISDEELLRRRDTRIHWRREWFGNQDMPVAAHCSCPTCRQWRGEQDTIEDRRKTEQEAEQEANSRARSLLLSCLSYFQRKEYETWQYFTVTSQSGRRYRIEQGYNFNIGVLGSQGSIMGRLCAGPDENVPVYDSMLAQKLWLENDEEGFLRVANRSGFTEDIPVYFGNRVALWRG